MVDLDENEYRNFRTVKYQTFKIYFSYCDYKMLKINRKG